LFKVFWATTKPHEEKVESAKKPKDIKNSDRGTVLLLIRVKKFSQDAMNLVHSSAG